MAITTSFMGLTAWDQGGDAYDHAQLAANFIVLDAHDHTTGKGKQLSGASIAAGQIGTSHLVDGSVNGAKILDGTITQAELANNSVGSAQIIDGSINTADIADGAITNAKLSASVNPLGSIRMWYRATASIPVPSGWEVCDGRAWSGVANTLGVAGVMWTTGNMPDFRNRFPLGAALSGTGSGVADPPDIGQVGGSMTINLSHSHTFSDHSHTVQSHSHSISSQAAHKHQFNTKVLDNNGTVIAESETDLMQRRNAKGTSANQLESLYVPGLNSINQTSPATSNNVLAPMTEEGAHDHGGVTGPQTGATDPGGSGTTTGTGTLGSAADHRNAYVGVLFIMRVI